MHTNSGSPSFIGLREVLWRTLVRQKTSMMKQIQRRTSRQWDAVNEVLWRTLVRQKTSMMKQIQRRIALLGDASLEQSRGDFRIAKRCESDASLIGPRGPIKLG